MKRVKAHKAYRQIRILSVCPGCKAMISSKQDVEMDCEEVIMKCNFCSEYYSVTWKDKDKPTCSVCGEQLRYFDDICYLCRV